jgi:hypothetical protein
MKDPTINFFGEELNKYFTVDDDDCPVEQITILKDAAG